MDQTSKQIEKRKRGRPLGSATRKMTKAEARKRRETILAVAEKVELDIPVSEAEACAYFGVARLTLSRMRKASQVRHYRLGDRILYSPTQLREDLERRAQAA